MTRMKTSFSPAAILFGAALLVCVAAGCASDSVYTDPTPEQVHAALAGRTIELDDVSVRMESADISGLRIVQILAGPEQTQASAILNFEYRHRGNTWKVDGVLTYQRSRVEPIVDAVFEANDVR